MKSLAAKFASLCLAGLVASLTNVSAATITVTSLADSGPGSFREALANAGDGDTIAFDPILIGKTIVLTSGELIVTNSVTINGLGADSLAISGNSASRVFSVSGNVAAAVAGLTLTGGNGAGTLQTTWGGAVYVDTNATLEIRSCLLNGNNSATGGAVYNAGTLTVTHSRLLDNSADTGGALANAASLTITNSLLADNFAFFGLGGGALYSTNGVVWIFDSALSSNNAPIAAAGAIFNDLASTVAIDHSALFANTSGNAAGAIYNTATLTITGSLLSSNSASFGSGGAIYSSAGTVTVADSTLADNTAGSGPGGGIYNASSLTMSNSALTGNTVSFDAGGGLYNVNGTVDIRASKISSNTALLGLGGGIYNAPTGTVRVSGSLLEANNSDSGGAIYNAASLTTSNSTLAGNTVGSNGGAIFNAAGATLDVLGGTVSGNNAVHAGGMYNAGDLAVSLGTITSNTAVFAGGIYNDATATTTLTKSKVTDNTADSAGGIYNVATLTIHRSTLTGNIAAFGTGGGGIYNEVGATLTLALSTLADNAALSGDGGGVLNWGTATIAECTFATGVAANTGGALANFAGTVTIDNTILATSLIGGNCGNGFGGSILSKGHNLSDDDSCLAFFTAPGDLSVPDAGLDPSGPADNGGPTPTIALLTGSAAIGAGGPVYPPFSAEAGGGEPIYPPFTDQRGFARFTCGAMDIGAFQTEHASLPIVSLIGPDVVTNECPASFVDPGATAGSTCGDALALAGGAAHSLALETDGTVAGWGADAAGQTTHPAGLGNAVAVAAGGDFSLALTDDGTVIGWGDNTYGQTNIPGGVSAIAIAAGTFHGLALQGDGTVVGWGNDSYGQVTGLAVSNAVAVAAGRYHSLALESDGTVVAWGAGTFVSSPEDGINYGQAIVPADLSNVVAIAAGAYHSLALKSDGTVVAWGGGSTNVSLFVDFGQSIVPDGLSNVVAIAAGGFHSLALQSDGTVVVWGNDNYGQTTGQPPLTDAVGIAAGTYHSLAIKRNGTVVGWGLDAAGQTDAPLELNADLTSQLTIATNGTPNALGTVTLTYSVQDARSNSNSATRTVVTADTLPPVPDVGSLPTVTGQCAASVTPPTATDVCAGVIIGTTADPTNYTSQGTFTVHWTYADGNGNTALQTQTVVVHDTVPPIPNLATLPTLTLECPASVAAPTALDNCAGLITATTGDPTSFVGPGTRVVHWTYSDGDGNTTNQSQTVIVVDTTAPVPNVAPLPTISGQCSASVTAPTATDTCAGTITGTTSDPTNYTSQGTFTVHWTYSDGHGNTTIQTQTVVVQDTLPPTVHCPSNIVVDAATLAGTVVTFATPTASDNCTTGAIAVVCSPASGSTFALGDNPVLCVAMDAAGNQGFCIFTITVRPARGILEDVLGQLLAARNAAPAKPDGPILDDAVANLAAALADDLWHDDSLATAWGGKTLFITARSATRDLKALRKNRHAVTSPSVLTNSMARIAQATRLVAMAEINAAVAAHADAKAVAKANRARTKGDAQAGSGNADAAIRSYQNAWSQALKAILKIK